MAKRGGAVFSHVRFGPEVWSPTIPRGKADILLALEWAEGLRWLNYMKRDGGIFIADTQQIVPPFACRNRTRGAARGYALETPKEILEKVEDGYALDATEMANELGNLRAANTVLLGVLSMGLDFSVDDWLSAIEQFVPPHSIEINRKKIVSAWVGDDPTIYFRSVDDVVRVGESIFQWCEGVGGRGYRFIFFLRAGRDSK